MTQHSRNVILYNYGLTPRSEWTPSVTSAPQNCRVRNNQNSKTKCNIHFVFPHLIYCIEIWGNASAIHLDPLTKKTFSESLFQRTSILNFDRLVFQRIYLMMFKILLVMFPNLFRIYSKLTIITAMVL